GDVDGLAEGTRCVIGGVMQHIEDAGVHSGDSACVMPPYLIGDRQVDEMRRYTKAFAEALGVVGLINVQYAIKDGLVYVLEVNPRGSRTVPFVSKATGVPLAKLAAAVMTGHTLDELGVPDDLPLPGVAVKEPVFPFPKLPGVDTILGPDMRSTGDVQLLINTPIGKFTQADDYAIRRAALMHRVPYTTTMSAASAACDAIIALRSRTGSVRSLQEWHERTTVENRPPGTAKEAVR